MSEHKLEIKIVADNRQAIAAIGDQARAMSMLAQKVEVAQADFRKLAAAVAVGHGAFAGLAATLRAMTVSLPRAVIATAAEFESLEAAMRAVFGSAEAVRREMDALRAMSDRLGLPLETLSRQWLSVILHSV